MKYTTSQDGKLRVTFRVPVRLTQEEMTDARREAQRLQLSFRQFLTAAARGGVLEWIYPSDGEEEQPRADDCG